MKHFPWVFTVLFVVLAVLEMVACITTNDIGIRTYHRVGMFGFFILANLTRPTSQT